MCDYSLETTRSRKAVKGDKLRVEQFASMTTGFTPHEYEGGQIAVCLLPGTEVAFDDNIRQREYGGGGGFRNEVRMSSATAIFRQMNTTNPHTHHDCLELPDGAIVYVNMLSHGQCATVIQLPADPQEAKPEATTGEPSDLLAV